jgi:D-alanine transfer protein
MIYVNSFINKVSNVDGLASVYNHEKFDGLLIEKKALSSHRFLFILDSSNLANTDCAYHPSNIFTRKASGFIPYLVGREGTTSFDHILKVAALNNSIRNQKVVFIVEPSYFLVEKSLKIYPHFSELHAYHFVFNSKIDRKLKAEIAASMLKNVGVYQDPVLTLLLKNLTQRHANKTVNCLISPIGRLILAGLEQKDHFTAYYLMIKNSHVPHKTAYKPSLDWSDLLKNAERDGENANRTNRFYIEDDKYENNIQSKLNDYRNYAKKNIYFNTREMNNTHLLLSLFKEFHIKPLLVIEPMNGFWSDFIGLNKNERHQTYTRIKHMIQQSGFGYADFSDHEYDKYFLRDTKHLGGKGWVYVDQAIDRFYHQ